VDWFELAVSLVVILFGAQLFTNGVEWIGERFGLSEGAVGSVLAAIGTALPETVLPLIAILSGGVASGKDIGVGAILGAPFMLSTLAMFVLGAAILVSARGGRRGTRLLAEPSVVRQDLAFFLVAYGAYVRRHFRAPGEKELEGQASGEVRPLYLRAWLERLLRGSRSWAAEPPGWASVGQTLVALALIVGGAKVFVDGMETLAHAFHVPTLVFALLVAPVATELPEQFNGVLWVGRRKDTLALGNVTGAMVFQSSFPVTIGMLLTPWHLTQEGLVAGCLALGAGLWLYLVIRLKQTLPAWLLLTQGVLYVGYVGYVLMRI
jgi:cation:H+ antiporter